ncbi:hypothetical protein PT974_00043 [Cladobotryum mycophilum]|uniref:Uncharacterized protein n=1 Tax=Cladobotryum mycophilum TaxID=491253 RepID=A0ABR0SZT2_9HYPO
MPSPGSTVCAAVMDAWQEKPAVVRTPRVVAARAHSEARGDGTLDKDSPWHGGLLGFPDLEESKGDQK